MRKKGHLWFVNNIDDFFFRSCFLLLFWYLFSIEFLNEKRNLQKFRPLLLFAGIKKNDLVLY